MEGGTGNPDEVLAMLRQYEAGVASGEFDKLPEIEELMQSVRASQGGAAPGPKGENIFPEPGFVVKSSGVKKDDGTKYPKVFLNLCGSTAIAAPGDWKGGVPEDVKRAMREIDDGTVSEQSESLRFPLSMSDGTVDTDKKGESCIVYDVVFNLDVLKIAMVEPRLKRFLVELAVGWLNHKHGVELDPNYKLPKMKYKGDLTPHRIRVDPKTLISEIQNPEEDEPTFPLLPGKGAIDTSRVPKGAKAAVERAANAEIKRKLSRAIGAGNAPGTATGNAMGNATRNVTGNAAGTGNTTGGVTGGSPAGGALTGGGASAGACDIGAGSGVASGAAQQEGTSFRGGKGAAGGAKAAVEAAERVSDARATPEGPKKDPPQFTLTFEGKPAIAAVVAIQVPYLVSAKDMKLTTLGLDLMLESATKYAPLKVPLPFFVDPDSSVATFVKHKGELRLYLPHRPVASVLDEMRRKKPHSLGTLELTDSSLLDLD